MMLVWTTASATLLIVSSAATFLTMLHLRFRWDVYASSVRWLFWLFFLFVWSWCVLRAVYYMWLSCHDSMELVDAEDPENRRTYGDIDSGIQSFLLLKATHQVWFVMLLGAGDLALMGIALTLFPLTYELGRLARISMDRGVSKERKQIKRYCIAISIGLVGYIIVLVGLAVRYSGYTKHTYRALLVVYGIQFVALAYMVFQLVRLKLKGREYETVHGTFVISPIYHRLQLIMLVYAFLAFQYQVSMVILSLIEIAPASNMGTITRVSRLLYNAVGLALSVTTSCSQACVFSAFAPCLPEDFEAQFLHQKFMTAPSEDLEPPSENVVFVYTDIESSSALWNTNGEMMGTATEIHDDILRSTLLKHRGYEVTTVGDAFQIAFHSMRDAIEYCLDVQLMLLVAKWPKEMEGIQPATVKQRSGRRKIFNGLRVRMGIHDVSDAEGPLVQDVHAVTGKATYTGLSEVIAEYVGDLGSGGQILMTGRVATWLKYHRDELSLDVYLEYMGEHTVPQVNTNVTLYQVLPAMLSGRRKYFTPLRIEYMATQRHIRLSQRFNSGRNLWNMRTTPVISRAESEAGSVATVLSPVESLLSESSTNMDSEDPLRKHQEACYPIQPRLSVEQFVSVDLATAA